MRSAGWEMGGGAVEVLTNRSSHVFLRAKPFRVGGSQHRELHIGLVGGDDSATVIMGTMPRLIVQQQRW